MECDIPIKYEKTQLSLRKTGQSPSREMGSQQPLVLWFQLNQQNNNFETKSYSRKQVNDEELIIRDSTDKRQFQMWWDEAAHHSWKVQE